VQVGRLPPDDDHPYGHGKFEAIGALFLALTLLGTGVSVGIIANQKLIEIISLQRVGQTAMETHLLPTTPALIMAFLSIVSKEWLFRVTRNIGESINSQVVIANAWHHRSDAYSSVLALFSIGLAMAGIAAADAAAGLLVAGMICMTGAEILGESVKQLTDHSDEELVRRITGIVANSKDVQLINRIRARQVGSSSVIDLSICIPEKLGSVEEARAVEERLRKIILQEPGVLDCEIKATSRQISSNDKVSSSMAKSFIEGDDLSFDRERIQSIISKAEIEIGIRDVILKEFPQVRSIKGITIHYQEVVTDPIDVDVDICLGNEGHETTTIASTALLAQSVREALEKYEKINSASIYLDLNFQIPQSLITNS
jgi:cation diffusion facilitator family transporter